MLGYLSLDIISLFLEANSFLELRFRKSIRFSEQIMSADKCPSIFSRQKEAIVHISRILTKRQKTITDFQHRRWVEGDTLLGVVTFFSGIGASLSVI